MAESAIIVIVITWPREIRFSTMTRASVASPTKACSCQVSGMITMKADMTRATRTRHQFQSRRRKLPLFMTAFLCKHEHLTHVDGRDQAIDK